MADDGKIYRASRLKLHLNLIPIIFIWRKLIRFSVDCKVAEKEETMEEIKTAGLAKEEIRLQTNAPVGELNDELISVWTVTIRVGQSLFLKFCRDEDGRLKLINGLDYERGIFNASQIILPGHIERRVRRRAGKILRDRNQLPRARLVS